MAGKGKAISRSPGISRRRFLRNAALGAAWAAGPSLIGCGEGDVPSRRSSRASGPGGRETVAVFGGGIAGLTAAHELAERGFDVTIYERRAWGGKARSFGVPDSGTGGRAPLPAEHGYRLVFPNYANLPETMRRIPFATNPDGVYENLVPAPDLFLARDAGRPPGALFTPLNPQPTTTARAVDLLSASMSWLPPTDIAKFVSRCVVFLSSGRARRYGQWEYQTWADFVHADQLSEGGFRFFNDMPTRFAAQSLAGQTSARTIGQGVEACIYKSLTGRGEARLLDAPTNEAWIDPWLDHLAALGVDLRLGTEVVELAMESGRIAGATVLGPNGRDRLEADWYVVALPVERATQLWTRDIIAADPQLARSSNISGGWMTGIQLYLREERPFTGAVAVCLDSPWAITFVSHAQFWKSNFATDFGDGTVRDKISAIIDDWDTPGILYGKKARDCTRAEIGAETWAQVKEHFTYRGATPLSDELLVGTFLDPGIRWEGDTIVGNDDPLPRSLPGTWDDRPEAASAILNLFVAGDYVKVDFDISSMEGAHESARRAVNALLDRAGSRESRVPVFEGWLPPEWAAFRSLDDELYAKGLPNAFDADLDLGTLRGSLEALSSPLARP